MTTYEFRIAPDALVEVRFDSCGGTDCDHGGCTGSATYYLNGRRVFWSDIANLILLKGARE